MPIDGLDSTAARMRATETSLAQSINALNKAWSSLKLESSSRAMVGGRVTRAFKAGTGLAADAKRLSGYLDLVNSRFVAADRQEENALSKSGMRSNLSKGANAVGQASMDRTYNKAAAGLALGNPLLGGGILAAAVGAPLAASGLKWIGGLIYKHGDHPLVPGEAGAAKNLAVNLVDGEKADKIMGDLTVDVTKIVGGKAVEAKATALISSKLLAGYAGKAVAGKAFLAFGGGVIGLAAAPIVAKAAIVVGVGAAVYVGGSYLSDKLFNINIKGKSVDEWVKGSTAHSYRTMVEKPGLMMFGPSSMALTGLDYVSRELVGVSVVNEMGNMATGLKNRILSKF